MRAHPQSGMSLIELMISLTIGLVLLAGLTVVFVNSSKAQRVGQSASQANDNARYAMDTITTDLHHAGYYGDYAGYAQGITLPDPCSTAPTITDLQFPVQGFIAVMPTGNSVPSNQYPSFTGTTCATLLPQANLMPGSDVLVVRRTDTTPVAVGSAAVAGQLYLQTSPLGAELQTGAGANLTTASQADGATAADLTIYNSTTSTNVAGPVNQYYVDIYFVAPCSVPKGGGATCTGANDDNGSPIPTLKMLQLGLVSGAMGFNTYTIAQGIQAMKLEFGIDNVPNSVSTLTGRLGDGQPDCYEPNSITNQPATTDYPNAVSIKVFMISRSVTTIKNFTDSKYYEMGSPTSFGFTSCGATGDGVKYGQYGDAYMRHGYESDIRLTNLSSRREIP